jgi:methionyl-tRNA synthetase
VDEYLDVFPPDPLRYYLEANAPENKDSDFAWKDFQAHNNNELADVLGNLVNRCLSFTEKNFENKVPPALKPEEADGAVLAAIAQSTKNISDALDKFHVRRAVNEMMDLARTGNKYFNDSAPWKSLKTDRKRCGTILNTTLQLMSALAVIMEPFLPFSAERLWRMLNGPGSHRDQHWASIPDLTFADGHPLGKREILFKKIEDEIIEEQIAKLKS